MSRSSQESSVVVKLMKLNVEGKQFNEPRFNLLTCDLFRAGLLNLNNIEDFVTQSDREEAETESYIKSKYKARIRTRKRQSAQSHPKVKCKLR